MENQLNQAVQSDWAISLPYKKPPLTLTYRVDGLIEKRVSAPEASHNVTNLTPPEELERVKKIHENAFFLRDRGAGRPTKKERRDLDKLTS